MSGFVVSKFSLTTAFGSSNVKERPGSNAPLCWKDTKYLALLPLESGWRSPTAIVLSQQKRSHGQSKA
jgi:hypothetical protein